MYRAQHVERAPRDRGSRQRSSRRLLAHLVVVALLSGVCVLVWALSGGGTFWPAAVILLVVAAAAINIAAHRLERPAGRVDELERQLRASSRK